MGWRKSHGARKDTNGSVRIEVQPPDELKKVNADTTEARVQHARVYGRPFVAGNRAAVGRRPKLARLGIDRADIDTTDPKYKACLRLAEAYRKKRVSEFKKTHGFVSVGAMSLIATASLQLAASRYMMEKAFAEGNMLAVKVASGIANDARQNELAAWELASREGGAKAKAAMAELPWVKARVDIQPHGGYVAELTEADNETNSNKEAKGYGSAEGR